MLLETLLSKLEKIALEYLEQVKNGELRVENLSQSLKEKVQAELSRLTCRGESVELAEWIVSEVVRGERSLGNHVIVLEAVLSDVGLIGASSGLLNVILEVGMTWDYLLDLPLVPGSSLKGAFRNLLLTRCARFAKPNERLRCLEVTARLLGWVEHPRRSEVEELLRLLKLGEEHARSIEGIAAREAHVGLLRFYDTHLVCGRDGRLLEPWVITPHYREAKTEYDVRPVPVEHVVLAEGSKGYFVVGVSPEAIEELRKLQEMFEERRASNTRDILAFLVRLLAATLHSGVGARTSRGYTYFQVVNVYVA